MPDIRQIITAAEAQVREPVSLEQREAGNYQKGHFTWCGLDITLESAKGMERKGVDRNGKAWSITLKNSYGYIKGTDSAEPGDEMDVFVGDDPEIELIYVVDQNKNDKPEFDEHKCIIGCANSADAKAVYLANYSAGWKGFRSVTALTVPQFKSWLENGDMTRPLKGQRYADFCKEASWADAGRVLRQQAPGFHLADATVGALAAGLPAYFVSAGDKKRHKNRWRNAALAALLGGFSANLIGDRARRYLSNIPGAFGYDPETLLKPAKREGWKGLWQGAVLDQPLNTTKEDDAYHLPGTWNLKALARRELFRRALGVHAPTEQDYFRSVGKTFEEGKWRDVLQLSNRFVEGSGALNLDGRKLWKDILHPQDWRDEVAAAGDGYTPTTSYIFANMPVRRMSGIEQIRDVWNFALQGGDITKFKEMAKLLVTQPKALLSKLNTAEAEDLLRGDEGTKLKALVSLAGRQVLDKAVAPSAPVFRQNFSVGGSGDTYMDKVRVLLDTPVPLPDDASNAKMLAGGAGLMGAAALADYAAGSDIRRSKKQEEKQAGIISKLLSAGLRRAAKVPAGQAFAPTVGTGVRRVLKLGFNPELGRTGNIVKRVLQGAGLYGGWRAADGLVSTIGETAGEAARFIPNGGKLEPTNRYLESWRDAPWATALRTAWKGIPSYVPDAQRELVKHLAVLAAKNKLHGGHMPSMTDVAKKFYSPAVPHTFYGVRSLLGSLVGPPTAEDYGKVLTDAADVYKQLPVQ